MSMHYWCPCLTGGLTTNCAPYMYPRVCREIGQGDGDGGDGADMTHVMVVMVMVVAEAMGRMIRIVNGYGVSEFEKTYVMEAGDVGCEH